MQKLCMFIRLASESESLGLYPDRAVEELSLYTYIASEHLDCTSIFCCLLPYLKGQNAGQFLNWMFFALSEGTKRSPIFKFDGIAAVISLTSRIISRQH